MFPCYLVLKVHDRYEGIAHWGNRIDVNRFEVHDSQNGLMVFGEASVVDGLINARTANTQASQLQLDATYVSKFGFQFYDTYVKVSELCFGSFECVRILMTIYGATYHRIWSRLCCRG